MEISLKHVSGQWIPATLDWGCRDWTENGRRRTECRITLSWAGGEIQHIEGDFFYCFRQVRKQLSLHELYPVCYGASRRTIVTGMAVGMGLGQRVYKNVELGRFPQRSQLVHIFASGEDVEPTSVEEQDAFKREWVQSMRSP